nr:hypothetical protein [Rhodoferax sp.]
MIPSTFAPPGTHNFALFQLAVLGPPFAEQDFGAVRASAASMRNVFGPANDWPAANISYAENFADLTRHAREFNERVAFAYAVLDAAGDGYLGCFYIKPIKSQRAQDKRKQLFQAQAFFWLSATQTALGDAVAFASLRDWLSECWPFVSVAWPGRAQSCAEWEALADA